MFLPTATQVSLMAAWDNAQNCPISFYQMLADSITITLTSHTFAVPSGLSLSVGDLVYIESLGTLSPITDITAGIATVPSLTLASPTVVCLIRKIVYLNGNNPYIYELMPKELGILSNMVDRTITRAWAARIAKQESLKSVIDANKRYVLDDGTDIFSVALLDNLVSGTANPNLAWSLYLVP